MFNHQPISLILIPGKIMDQVLIEHFSRPMKEKVVTENSPHGFTEGKSAPTSLIAF